MDERNAGTSRREFIKGAAALTIGAGSLSALENPLTRIARAMSDPAQISPEALPAQTSVEVLDYENARLLGEIPAHSPDSLVRNSDGTIAFSATTYHEVKDDSFNVYLGTTRPETTDQKMEIYMVDPVDSRAIVQIGKKDNKVRAAYVNEDNDIIVRTYNVDYQVESDLNLGDWFVEGMDEGTPLRQHEETYYVDTADSLANNIKYWVNAFNIVNLDGRQAAVVAQQSAQQIDAAPDRQPQAHFKMMIADLETGKNIKIEAESPVRRPGEVVYLGDNSISEIVQVGGDILALTQLGLWRTSKDPNTEVWSTQYEPFDIPKFWRKEMSYPSSLSFDPKSGNILYAASMADIYCGVLKRNPDGKGWTSTENQLVLQRTDEEPWNGIVGGMDYVHMPQTRPHGSDDVVLMVPSVWFGEPFDIRKMFGIVQEPILFRDGKFTRSNQHRTRGVWELQGNTTAENALLLTSQYEPEPDLKLISIDYKGIRPAVPTPTATAEPTEIPTPTATPRIISRRELFLPRVSR